MTRNDQLVDELHEWAKGSLPLMAAVDFVVATGTDLAPMVGHENGRIFLDVFVDDERAPDYLTTDQWLDRVGTMSSGQRATWELARSIAGGELNEWFWRLDARRKLAFATALLSTTFVVGPRGGMVASSYDDARQPTSITCPRCGRTSHNPVDVREGYCGSCHAWTTT